MNEHYNYKPFDLTTPPPLRTSDSMHRGLQRPSPQEPLQPCCTALSSFMSSDFLESASNDRTLTWMLNQTTLAWMSLPTRYAWLHVCGFSPSDQNKKPHEQEPSTESMAKYTRLLQAPFFCQARLLRLARPLQVWKNDMHAVTEGVMVAEYS